MEKSNQAQEYTGKDITVLQGLEPVRLRPGMYIGGTGPDGLHHLLWEVVDNAVDEAINGFASRIDVVLHADGCSVSVADDGRGIPVDEHPIEKRSALEVILTTLHAGAKFSQENYLTSGGLHGVGSSVVNALSSELEVEVKRDGRVYTQTYSRGVPQGPVTSKRGKRKRDTGTRMFFRPDPEIFTELEFDPSRIVDVLETKAFVIRGLEIAFRDETLAEGEEGAEHHFKYDSGIIDLLGQMSARDDSRSVHPEPFTLFVDDDMGRFEFAFTWTDATSERIRSFANAIPTRDGGTHEQGMRDGIIRSVRAYLDTHELIPRGVSLTTDDIREGLKAVISVFVAEPQFQGQTKGRLNNPELKAWISSALRLELEGYLNQQPTTGQAIATRIIQAARARLASRAAANSARRSRPSSKKRLNLPGKLADCTSSDPSECEIFIVEGDSAGGSAKQGRERLTQAILPLRGKVLNAEQASLNRVSKNKELSDVVSALGCGFGPGFDISRLRYHKVILLMDADSDGNHIATLLLTFFYRYLPRLIEEGHVYLAQPPLYRINLGKKIYWAQDDAQKNRILGQLKRRRGTPVIQRFKGLGEMMPKTLYETTLDPRSRMLLQVTIPEEARLETENVISDLMGKDAQPRFEFIMQNANLVDDLDV